MALAANAAAYRLPMRYRNGTAPRFGLTLHARAEPLSETALWASAARASRPWRHLVCVRRGPSTASAVGLLFYALAVMAVAVRRVPYLDAWHLHFGAVPDDESRGDRRLIGGVGQIEQGKLLPLRGSQA